MRESLELAVIGAGPAGLAAARAAVGAGVEAVVFDEQATPGGQIYRDVEATAAYRPGALALLGEDYRAGLELVQGFRQSGAEFRGRATVWELRGDGTLGVSAGERARLLSARRVILAGGAMERPVPVPGWTLPGVMGLGAAQTLLKGAATVPAGPTVVAGSGPLVYLAAWQLARAGVELKAVLLTTPRGAFGRAARHLPAALRAPGHLRKGLGWMRALRAMGVPLLGGVQALRAEGRDRLEAVAYRRGGRDERIRAEVLLLHEGVVPNVQLSQAAHCAHVWDAGQLCWRPVADGWGATDQELIAVAGDGAGIAGARAAEHRGTLAGLEAARRLGRLGAEERDRRATPPRRALRREVAIRPFLDALYRPATDLLAPEDDATIVCRCEEVTAGEIRDKLTGLTAFNELKHLTRAGMGPCQGRMCGPTVAEIMRRATGMNVGQFGWNSARPPVKPLALRELAQLASKTPTAPGLQVDEGEL